MKKNDRLFVVSNRSSLKITDNRVLTCGYHLSILTLMSDRSETINKQRRRAYRRSGLCVLVVLFLPLLAFSMTSCKPAVKKPAAHKQKAENVPIMKRGRILADVKDGIAIIESAETDWQVLKPAVAGKALNKLKAQIEDYKAENLVKLREYDDLKLKFGGAYEKGVMGVTAEYLDSSTLVNISNGQTMAVSRAEKKKLFLGVSKIDGTWKIISILGEVETKE